MPKKVKHSCKKRGGEWDNIKISKMVCPYSGMTCIVTGNCMMCGKKYILTSFFRSSVKKHTEINELIPL